MKIRGLHVEDKGTLQTTNKGYMGRHTNPVPWDITGGHSMQQIASPEIRQGRFFFLLICSKDKAVIVGRDFYPPRRYT